MSKIKLLLDVVQDMRSLADSLQAVADAIAENEPADTPEENTGKISLCSHRLWASVPSCAYSLPLSS